MGKLKNFIQEHRNASIVIGGILAVTLIGCCLVGVFAGGGEEAAPKDITKAVSEPTSTIAFTATPMPTDTLEPTETLKPTNTPKPTSTPEPTNTPEPTATAGLTSAEQEYLAKVGEISDQYSSGFTKFSEYVKAAREDPSLIVDDSWKVEVAAVLGAISILNEEIRALDFPQSCEGIHSHLLNAVNHYEQFVTLFAEGIDEMSVDKMNRANEELLLGNEAINKATERVNELTD